MTLAAILSVNRHILTGGGLILVNRGIIDQTELDTAIGAIITLIGLAWAIIDKKGRKGNANALPVVAVLVIPALLVLVAPMSGCAHLTPEQKQELTNRLVKGVSTFALSMAAHEFVESNPEYKPYVRALSMSFTQAGEDGIVEFDEVYAMVDGYLKDNIEDPFYRLAVRQLLTESLADYASLAQDTTDTDPRLSEALKKIGLALAMAVEPTTASGPEGISPEFFAL